MIRINKAKIWETGTSYVVTIPKAYIRNGQLKLDAVYSIEIKEVKEDDE